MFVLTQWDTAMIYNSILDTIGNTPVVRLNNIAPAHVDVFVKVESFNPMGSVKDRLAFAIIDDAEKRGVLKPGQTVVEATSGNTGIALVMCRQRLSFCRNNGGNLFYRTA